MTKVQASRADIKPLSNLFASLVNIQKYAQLETLMLELLDSLSRDETYFLCIQFFNHMMQSISTWEDQFPKSHFIRLLDETDNSHYSYRRGETTAIHENALLQESLLCRILENLVLSEEPCTSNEYYTLHYRF